MTAPANSIVVKDEITPTLGRMAIQFPNEFRRGLHNAGQRWRARMAQKLAAQTNVMGGKLAALHPVTMQLRRQRLRDLSKKRKTMKFLHGTAARRSLAARSVNRARAVIKTFGGKMPSLFRYSANNMSLAVGWLDIITPGITRSGVKYQTAVTRPLEQAERAFLHRRLGMAKLPITMYRKPERSVVAPGGPAFVADVNQSIAKTIAALQDRRGK